jgi:integrase
MATSNAVGAAKMDTRGRRPVSGPERKGSLAWLAEKVMQSYEADGVSRAMRNLARRLFRTLEANLGIRDGRELESEETLRRFQRHNARSSESKSTRDTRQAVFNNVVRRAHRLGLLRKTPLLPKQSGYHAGLSPRTEAPLRGDVDRLWTQLAAADEWEDRRFRALTATVLLGGISVGDVAQLRVRDVDVAGGAVAVRSGRRSRLPEAAARIRIRDDLTAVLGEWLGQVQGKYAFPETSLDTPWGYTPRGLTNVHRRRLKAVCCAAGIDPVTFEQLRRFRAENPSWRPPAGPEPAVDRPESATSPGPPLPTIRLDGPEQPFYVDGNQGRTLKASEFDVLRALADEGPDRLLSGEHLKEKSGRASYWRILRGLRDEPLLRPLLIGGGRSWAGYGLRAVRAPSLDRPRL